jgi:hypothetical protein
MKSFLTLIGIGFLAIFNLQAQMESGKKSTGFQLGARYLNNTRNLNSTPVDVQWTVNTNINQELFISRNNSIILGSGFEYTERSFKSYRSNNLGAAYLFESYQQQVILSPWIGYRKYWFSENGRFSFSILPYIQFNHNRIHAITYSLPSSLGTITTREEEKSASENVNINIDIVINYFVTPSLAIELFNSFMRSNLVKNYQIIQLQPWSPKSIGIRYYY